ncbi:MAG: hypothetical protein ABIW46_09410, partial [Acidimicrobiales bacterium]
MIEPMTENKVRQMLERRAGDVTPSPDAWEQIEERLSDDGGEDAKVVPMPDRASRRLSPLLVAAAVMVALGVGAAVVSRPDGGQRVDTTPAQTGTAPTTTPGTAST